MAKAYRPDPSASRTWPTPSAELQEAIRRRAEEIYIRQGRIPGRDVQNWIQAENEVLQQYGASPIRRKAVVVNVKGEQYVGEYTPDKAEGYTPGEFCKGEPVPVRFVGDKMFITRPNGSELETTIVDKIG